MQLKITLSEQLPSPEGTSESPTSFAVTMLQERKEKRTTKKPNKMPNPDEARDVPQYTVKNYPKVSLYIDVMHVNGIMFLVGVSRHIGLVVQCVCIRKKNREKFLHAIFLMIHKYCSQGIFDVVSIGTDKAFDTIESEIKDEPYNVTLTTCDADHQVEYVERMIRFVKERIRIVRVTMPYKSSPSV